MAGHDGKKHARSAKVGRRMLVGMGAGAGVFLAAAAMATGSAVTAAPAHADFEELLDPIIQPLLTSLTDSIGAFDPAAALDLTSWTDSFLASLNSIDLALPSADSAVSAAATGAEPASSAGSATIPIVMQEVTEPTVQATVDGADTSLLVDTGSSGLVIPYTDLGSNYLTQLEALYALGTPTGISESGYSGGVDYLYLTYNNVDVSYGNGALDTTNTPVEVEVYSWDPSNFFSYFTNSAFQDFLHGNDVTGILGIGDNTAGPASESPLAAAGYNSVLLDIPHNQMVIGGDNPLTGGTSLDGAPNIVSSLTETVTNSANHVVGTGTVTNDLDSGGVYGTIPSSIAGSGSLAGDTISVYDGNTLLYSYQVGTDSLNQSEAPTAVTGTSIDSGIKPFMDHEVYINYANDTMYIGPQVQ
jgi:hypothetical protein